LTNELNWTEVLKAEKQNSFFKDALKSVARARKLGTVIYPSDKHIFEAFRITPLNQLKVVILGQDPYHQQGQAHGLCFSVPKGIRTPPSLRNIYKELHTDLGCSIPEHGNLQHWAEQGVLLLNTVLTVVEGKPQSHQDIGWQQFTDEVIRLINQHCQHVVFLLWGANAQKKQALINSSQHTIFSAPHPSPLSCYRGFFGCKHFSKTNQCLIEHHQQSIDWCID